MTHTHTEKERRMYKEVLSVRHLFDREKIFKQNINQVDMRDKDFDYVVRTFFLDVVLDHDLDDEMI